MSKYVIGIDFGTMSGRAVLIEITTGEIIASAIKEYKSGVIDEEFPGELPSLPSGWALQNPRDWLEVFAWTVPELLRTRRVNTDEIIGIGVAFTASTILPVLKDGTPLSYLGELNKNPHAWCKLWKHHAAQSQADRINEHAESLDENWRHRYGGRVSSEWLLPKSLSILENAPEIYHAADLIVEGSDWIVWQLTGNLIRNACAAGYKGLYDIETAYPSQALLGKLHPGFEDFYSQKVSGNVQPPGFLAGGLTSEWAEKVALRQGTPVAVSMIDAHAAMLGSGVSDPGTLFMAMGTSTCHLVLGETERKIEGVAGVVKDGIVPGYFGYEAGQSGVGDIFAWFTETCVPPTYHEEAKLKRISLHKLLSEKAQNLAPGQSGLIALDWWNGNRSTLMDAELRGMFLGCDLRTQPEEMYRSLIEGTAFGTRKIVEAFRSQGVQADHFVAGGGLTANPLVMQIYADILNHDVGVAGADHAAALGAGILAAVAAGPAREGYQTISQAVEHMAPKPRKNYRPEPDSVEIYKQLYREYSKLYDYFGREAVETMKLLHRLRAGEKEEYFAGKSH